MVRARSADSRYAPQFEALESRCHLTANPAISVLASGGGGPIAPGDASPAFSDGTNFGALHASDTVLTHHFTIHNSGGTSLQLAEIWIGGRNAASFVVTPGNVFPASIAPGASREFGIEFDPPGGGLRTARVHIQTSDPARPDFRFTVEGVGRGRAVIVVSINGTPISNDTSVNIAAVFPAGPPAGPSLTFTIANTGERALQLGGLSAGRFRYESAPFPIITREVYLGPLQITHGIGESLLLPGHTTTFSVRKVTSGHASVLLYHDEIGNSFYWPPDDHFEFRFS